MKGKEKRRTAASLSAAALILGLAFFSCKTNADGGETPEPAPEPTPVTLSAKTDVSSVEGASLSDGVFTLSVGTGTDASLIAAFDLNNLVENGSGDRTFTVADTAEFAKITGLSGWTGDASPYTIGGGKLKGTVTATAEISTENIEILVSDSTTGENPLSLKVKISVTAVPKKLSLKTNIGSVKGALLSGGVYTLTAKTGTDVSTVEAFDLNNLLENGSGERTFAVEDSTELEKVAGLSGWSGESSPYAIAGGKLAGTVTASETTTSKDITVAVSDGTTGLFPLALTVRISVTVPSLTGVSISGNKAIEKNGETTLSALPQGENLEDAEISYKWEITGGSDLAELSSNGANATLKGKGVNTGGTVKVSVTAILGGKTVSGTYGVNVAGETGKSSVEITSIEENIVSAALLELMDGGTLVVNDTATTEIIYEVKVGDSYEDKDNGIRKALLNVTDKKITLDLSKMSSLVTLKAAFYKCKALKKVILPSSVSKFSYSLADSNWNGPFSSCSSLESIVIPSDSKLTELNDYTFSRCSVLKDVTLPDSITKIGGYVFEYCLALENLTIPRNVTNIGAYMIYYQSSQESMTKLKTVTFADTTGWTVNGAAISVENPEQNAINLRRSGDWYGKELTKTKSE